RAHERRGGVRAGGPPPPTHKTPPRGGGGPAGPAGPGPSAKAADLQIALRCVVVAGGKRPAVFQQCPPSREKNGSAPPQAQLTPPRSVGAPPPHPPARTPGVSAPPPRAPRRSDDTA